MMILFLFKGTSFMPCSSTCEPLQTVIVSSFISIFFIILIWGTSFFLCSSVKSREGVVQGIPNLNSLIKHFSLRRIFDKAHYSI